MLTDSALVLRRHRYGESSLVTHVLTRKHGLVHFLAKGAYRPKSAFCGVLDLFDTLEVSWTPNRRSELQLLRAGRVCRTRRPIPRDIDRYRRALASLELVDLAARPEQDESELFGALELGLDRFAAGLDTELTGLAFDLHFLGALGLAPALEGCAACGTIASDGRESPKEVLFSAGSGGRLCPACARKARAAGASVGPLPIDILRIADALCKADTDLLATYRLSAERRSRVRDFVERFLEYHLESRPRSRRIIQRPRRTRTRTART